MKNGFKNKTRKIVTLLLALCLIVGVVPFATIGVSAEEETLASVDPISIFDLGLGMSYAVPASKDMTFNFTPADKTGRSAIVKFDINFTGQVTYIGFYNWEKYALIASDNLYFQTANGQYLQSDEAVTTGRHSFEFGKLQVLSGSNVGKDYMYVKLDGELVHTFYTDAFTGNPIEHLWIYTGGTGTVLYDSIERVATEETLATADPISIYDLGVGMSYAVPASKDVTLDFTPLDPQKRSAIMKFDIDFTGQVTYIGFYNWEKYALIASDNLYFQTANGEYMSSGKAVATGRHSFEFGKLAVLTGDNAGKDYMYVKFDGVLIHTFYTDAFISRPIDHLWIYSGASGTVLYDNIEREQSEETFAEADPVSINDLGLGMSYDLAVSDNGLKQDYTPDDPQQRSAVVTFDVDFAGDIRVGFQSWTECLWIASDCVRFGKNDSNGWEENYQAVSTGRHSVELGKLAVLTGANAGKDYFYVKLDGELVLSYYTTAYIAAPITYVWFYTNKTGTVLYDNKPAVSYAPYDEITVSDLTGSSSFTFSDTDTYFGYLPTVDNNTKVFRFNLVPNHGAAIQIGMNDWDQRFWLPGRTEFYLVCEGNNQQNFTWNVGQSYEVELGCKLVTSEENNGMDYVYVKVDGTIYKEVYTSHKTTQRCNLLFYGSNVTISDVDDTENCFDTYDVISLSDLGLSGSFAPSGEDYYTYGGISRTGSKVFEFNYNHNQSGVAANLAIAFNGWNRRMQIYNKSQIVLCTEGDATREEFNNLSIAANVDHRVKYGNIRITSGVNAGKDLQFAVLDGKLVAYEITDPLPDDLRTVMIYADSSDGTEETLKNVSLSAYNYANIDDEKYYFVGNSIVAPDFDGSGFVGWKSNGGLYPAGAEIPVDGNVELQPVSDLYFLIDENATLRLDSSVDGLRFTTRLDTYDYATLEDFIAEKGTIIAPVSNFAEDELFTLENLAENATGGLVKIVNHFVSEDDDDCYVWIGTLGNVKPQNLARDFAARGYLKIAYSDNSVKYIYTDIAKYSMYQAACDFYRDSTDEDLKNSVKEKYINTVADIVISGSNVSVSEDALGDYKGQTATLTASAITFSGTNSFKSVVINGVGMTIGDCFEVNGEYYSITGISGSVISLVEIQTPVLAANTYGYGIHWNEIAGVTEYAVNDSNDYRDGITFTAGAKTLPDGVTYADGVYTYVPTVVGKHDVSVKVTNANGSAISHTVSAQKVQPVYAYWGTRNGLYYFTADNLTSVTGLTTEQCQFQTDGDKTLYIAYRTADGWSANVNDRVGSDNNAERRAKDLANLKAMGANVIFLENGGGDFNSDTTWSISRLKNIMDDAWGMGMKVVVCDTVVFNASRAATSQADTNTLIYNRLANTSEAYNYMMHPAFYGWTFVDEPTYQTIDSSIRYTANALKTVAQNNGIEDYLFVSALQPAIGGRGGIFGSADETERLTGYRELEDAYPYYIKKYLEVTGMNYFTFDSYTPYCAQDGSKTQTSIYNSYLNTYTWLTKLMNEPGLEDVQIGQALTSFAYAEGGLVPADVMFSAAAAMANGADFISWFAYYPHYVYGDFGQTVVDYDGNPTSIYTAVQKATVAFNNMRPIIGGYKTTSFSNDANNLMTTTVTDGESTYHWYLNFNNTQGTAKNVTKSLAAGTQYYLFDAATNNYGTLNVQSATGNVTLTPGAAILVLG